MDIEKIKEIVNSPHHTTEMKEMSILHLLAMDPNAIPDILKILSIERSQNQEMISDMNSELAKSFVFIEALNPALLPKGGFETTMGKQVNKNWILDQICGFYVKYKGRIKYPFNRFE